MVFKFFLPHLKYFFTAFPSKQVALKICHQEGIDPLDLAIDFLIWHSGG